MSANRQDVTATIKRLEVLIARAGRAGAGGQLASLGLYAAIQAVSGSAAQPPPSAQTGAVNTNVAAVMLFARSSGIFGVSVRASWSDGTTAGSVTHSLVSKQGASTGALAGTGAVGNGKIGSLQGSATIVNSIATLQANAAGGVGITFEGSGVITIAQHSDVAGTLTGLLTANGIGTQNFESGFMMCDATGSTSNVKTPFTIGKPACFALQLSSTAAHVITYDSVSFFAQEMPFA